MSSDAAVDDQASPRSAIDPNDLLIDRNREWFERLLARAARYAARERYDLAAAWAGMAADQACHGHPGFFADDRLEQLLLHIGAMTMTPAHERRTLGADPPRNVLHVLTTAYGTGGHTRFAWRWIEADRCRRHSVVLTRQWPWGQLPQPLLAAAQSSGGSVRALDWRRDLTVARARQLRHMASDFDLIVLHVHPFDPIPLIAFAGGGPPIVLVNHAGFSFWVGRDVADVVACLRPSTREVAVKRRGIDPARCPSLPIPVSLPDPTVSRSQAREALGLRADAVVLFTVATASKYVPFESGCSFVDLVTSLARADERVEVRAIGPDDEGIWSQARERTKGRVRALGRHPDVELHERAADIYLDPFPVTSPTAFLEAGSHGLPIVSFCPHRERAAVLCADDFVMDDRFARIENAESFAAEVGRLVDDAAAREALGRATAEAIIAGHGPQAFAARLPELYSRAAASRRAGPPAAGDSGQTGPLDRYKVRMQEASRTSPAPREIIARHRDSLPFLPRQWLRVKARLGSYLAPFRSVASQPNTGRSASVRSEMR